MRRLAVPVLSLCLLLPATATATGRLTIRGAGFGHGVGMSQYGAEGYARHGWRYPAILRHYYSGTALGSTSPRRAVRVLLGTYGSLSVSHVTRAGGRRLDARKGFAVDAAGGHVHVGRHRFGPTVWVSGPGYTAFGARLYRGGFRLTAAGGSVQVVNVVGLDDYVQGVVPAEVFVGWHDEAFKAQAVAARTYAITAGAGRLLDDGTASQVYRGIGVETPRTNAAVRATRGRIVTYHGAPAITYFFSTSGGRTEDVENSFVGAAPEPWLRSVRDPYDGISPVHRWRVNTTMAAAGAGLRGLYAGRFRGIKVLTRGVSPRIVRARVLGTRGSTITTGGVLRARLGLRDTWATFNGVTSGKRAAPAPAPTAPPPPSGGGGVGPGGGGMTLRLVLIPSRPVAARPPLLVGEAVPARRGAQVVVQCRAGRHWVRAGTARVGRDYRYAWRARRAGTYRAVWGGTAGPAVKL